MEFSFTVIETGGYKKKTVNSDPIHMCSSADAISVYTYIRQYTYSVMQQIRDDVCCMLFSNNSDQVRFLKMVRHTTEAPEIEWFALPATYGYYWLCYRAFSNQQWTQTSIGTIWITYINWHHLYLKTFFFHAMSWWTMFGCRALHEGRLSMMLDGKTPSHLWGNMSMDIVNGYDVRIEFTGHIWLNFGFSSIYLNHVFTVFNIYLLKPS